MFTEFKKQQEMDKIVQETFVFDEIIVSILNNIRNFGLTYKHRASSQTSPPSSILTRMYVAQRRPMPPRGLYLQTCSVLT